MSLTELEQIDIIGRPYPQAAPTVRRCVSCHNEYSPENLFFAKDQYTGLTGWVCRDSIEEHGYARIISLADFLAAQQKETT